MDRRSFIRTGILALFLVVVAVSGSVLTGGGQGGKPEPKEPKPDRTFTKRCDIGKPCELGNGVFVLVSAELRDSIRISLTGSRSINGPIFLLRWRWRWQGDVPRYAIRAPRPLILRDSQGRVYEESFEPTEAYQIDRGLRAGFAKQNPGQTLRGASVYMIPADAYGFSLDAAALVHPTMKEVARYDLGPF